MHTLRYEEEVEGGGGGQRREDRGGGMEGRRERKRGRRAVLREYNHTVTKLGEKQSQDSQQSHGKNCQGQK